MRFYDQIGLARLNPFLMQATARLSGARCSPSQQPTNRRDVNLARHHHLCPASPLLRFQSHLTAMSSLFGSSSTAPSAAGPSLWDLMACRSEAHVKLTTRTPSTAFAAPSPASPSFAPLVAGTFLDTEQQQRKEQIKQQVQQELQLVNAQELINVRPLPKSCTGSACRAGPLRRHWLGMLTIRLFLSARRIRLLQKMNEKVCRFRSLCTHSKSTLTTSRCVAHSSSLVVLRQVRAETGSDAHQKRGGASCLRFGNPGTSEETGARSGSRSACGGPSYAPQSPQCARQPCYPAQDVVAHRRCLVAKDRTEVREADFCAPSPRDRAA